MHFLKHQALNLVPTVSTIIGVLAMLLAVIATFSPPGSLLQKILFMVAVPTLGFTAWIGRQKMFVSLQAVATVGAILAFLNSVPTLYRYAIMLGSAITAIYYLIRVKYADTDQYWPFGAPGLLCIAAGLATDASAYPLLFNALLAAGGVQVALYSGAGFFKLKIRIAALWLILNIIFSLNPLITIASFILKR